MGGLIAALFIHHVSVGKGLFRTVFLLPYALSFIVTGVAWRWIFSPSTGVNEILSTIMLNLVAAQRFPSFRKFHRFLLQFGGHAPNIGPFESFAGRLFR